MRLQSSLGAAARGRDTEKAAALASLRLLFLPPNFEGVYLNSVNSYKKVVNCKNVALELIFSEN